MKDKKDLPKTPNFNSSGNLAFDPDEFKLTKKMILRFMDAIEKRWKKDTIATIKNTKYLIGLEAMKVGIMMSDEDTISKVWHDILNGFNELITLNQMARLRGEFQGYEKLCDIVITRIENGETIQQTHSTRWTK